MPDEERGRRSSWRDKWRWPSRSRKSSQNPPISLGRFDDNVNVQANDSIAVAEDDTVAAESIDLWSAAYREAVSGFGEEVKSVILKGERIEKLFTSLEETNERLAGDSLFRKGVQRLQAPLRNFKLALDIASPLTSIEPTASTAVGVVRSVTAVSLPTSKRCGIRGVGSTSQDRLLSPSAEPKTR